MTTVEAVLATPIEPYLFRLDDNLTRDAMWELHKLFDDIGYRDLYSIATNGELYAPSPQQALTRINELTPENQAAVSFFGLGLPLATHVITKQMAKVVTVLDRCGLVTTARNNQLVTTRDYVVVPCLGGYLLVGTPPMYRSSTDIGATAYLGQDSLVLADALPPLAHKRVLDLGAGCGIQGLLAARGASEVVLTDIDSESLMLAACNQHLNSPAHRVHILLGDGYGPIADERFDLIVTLAPYVPSVPDSCTSRTVAGGDDGLTLIRRFAGQAADHLSVGGEFIALAQLFCDDDGPLIAKELDELIPELDSRLILSNWNPLQPYIFALASKLTDHGADIPRAELVKRYTMSLRSLGATGVCTAIIRLRRPSHDSTTRRREILGTAPTVRRSDVASLGPNTVHGDRNLSWIACVGGAMYPCNGPTSALIQHIDGKCDIATLTEKAWGPFVDASRLDLEDQAISRLGELARTGAIQLSATSLAG